MLLISQDPKYNFNELMCASMQASMQANMQGNMQGNMQVNTQASMHEILAAKPMCMHL